MATTTGKAARRAHGTRFAAKAAKKGRGRRAFGALPISYIRMGEDHMACLRAVGEALARQAREASRGR